jgi:hypothetical protein
MPHRATALESFYSGPVWKEHREAANATMVDVENVLLLRPVDRPAFSLAKRMTALMVATIYLLQSPVDDGFVKFFRQRVEPVMAETGAPPVAMLRTEYAPNNFPKLPVREGEHAFVWFAAYGSAEEYRRHLDRLAASPRWRDIEPQLNARLKSTPQRLQLVPTRQSLQRNSTRYFYLMNHTGDVHDFDFIAGEWTGVNRRLTARGVGSTEWDVFPSQHEGQVLMNGVVNVDEVVFPTKGWAGVTFRHFDLEKKQWSIYWVNSRDGRMVIAPQIGGFDGDIGLFYGEDQDDGRPVKVVYKWTRMGTNAARWEQAFSYDDGESWETNWVAELERR